MLSFRPMSKRMNIFLIGPMGVGKTTIGRYLAKNLHKEFYDSDHVIEERAGADIPWIFDVEGEASFREREAVVIGELTQLQDIVLATGGGAVITSQNREALAARGVVVYLHASIDQLIKRTSHLKKRPLLLHHNPRDVFKMLQEHREKLYRELADYVFDTDSGSPVNIAKQIVNIINKAPTQ